MSAPFELAGISLDCDDPESLASFYLRLLGGHLLWNNETSAGIRIPSGLTLIAQRVEPYIAPVWPGTSVIHFDLAADTDLTAVPTTRRGGRRHAGIHAARPTVAGVPRSGGATPSLSQSARDRERSNLSCCWREHDSRADMTARAHFG